ncbi:hypothetical protein DS2_08600 [Catenovulum agarivorans DS-2]|uniref:Large polyvalent protein-associated domain-containing protein n=1 Tax=Catenovulum agarivorans DS-2 TaxID=1328313 RepID=W7QYB6_9ALTE|nr:CLCA_X family protein [Catenovulum agarivorans]EWH10320.1 hypothetical protein DS2_08600 [Catenovulum agarivorans DS-2]
MLYSITLASKSYYRNGQQYRQADVTFADIRRQFGFRAIHIGRWVTQQEQTKAANLIYDALMDLATILQVPPQVLSLRNTLSLAFGTGGQLGVQAHYELNRNMLALAKNAGAGALAHEWFHAFDHYITDKVFTSAKQKFASHAWLLDRDFINHPLNLLLVDVYKQIFLSTDGTKVSQLFSHCAQVDNQLGQVYYALPEELAARCFEAFIQDHKVKNQYLVSGTKQTQEAKLGLFPTDQHRSQINQAFSRYFSQLGYVLSAAQ